MRDNSVYVIWPYAAVGIFVIGTLLRYVLRSRQPSALAEEISDARAIFRGRLFQISMLLLIAGHLAGLIFPRIILSWDRSPAGLYLLEGLALAAGLAAVGSCAVLIWRQVAKSSRSGVTQFFDTLFLGLLFAVLVSGVLSAILYRWGSSWGEMILVPYIASLLRGRPAVELATQLPALSQLHMLATFAAIAVAPLTRLSAFFVAALHRCVLLVTQPFRVTTNSFASWSSQHNPGSWFWPDED